jgi:hypothetical protein
MVVVWTCGRRYYYSYHYLYHHYENHEADIADPAWPCLDAKTTTTTAFIPAFFVKKTPRADAL